MGLVPSLIVFVVSLLIGGLGVYVGALFVAEVDDYSHALVTALIGAIVWSVVAFFFGWIPLLGPLLALLAYLAVVNSRYPGGWFEAAAISLVAWVTAFVVLYVLAALNVVTPEAFGVPGI